MAGVWGLSDAHFLSRQSDLLVYRPCPAELASFFYIIWPVALPFSICISSFVFNWNAAFKVLLLHDFLMSARCF